MYIDQLLYIRSAPCYPSGVAWEFPCLCYALSLVLGVFMQCCMSTMCFHSCTGFTKWLNFILAPTDSLGHTLPNTGRGGTHYTCDMWCLKALIQFVLLLFVYCTHVKRGHLEPSLLTHLATCGAFRRRGQGLLATYSCPLVEIYRSSCHLDPARLLAPP